MSFSDLRRAAAFFSVEEWTTTEAWLLGVGDSTFSLYGDTSGAVHFDLEGRWSRASLGGRTFLRGLDGRVLARFAGAGSLAGDETLDEARRRELHAEIHGLVVRAGLPAAGTRAGVEQLERASGWTTKRLEGERARFLEVYRPLGVVPPDRYGSLIIQATHGCAYNGCLFCELYRGQRARVVPPDELRAHVRAVKAFVGSGVSRRRGVFLGEANALAMPQAAVLESLAVVADELPQLVHSTGVAGGVSSFVDAFTASDKGVHEYAALAVRGLRRVFVGLESGDAPTLQFLRKPETAEGVRALVGALKQGGLSVGMIVLVGAGGLRLASQHVARSAELVASLPLDRHDLVYLSPLVVAPGGRFEHEAARAGLGLPSAEGLRREEAALRAALGDAGVTAQVARYDVRRFVYQ